MEQSHNKYSIGSAFASKDDLAKSLAKALENNRILSEKLAAAEEVIETAREWKAAAIAADRRAVKAEKRVKEVEAAAEYARKQRDMHRDDFYALEEIADIIYRRFGKP